MAQLGARGVSCITHEDGMLVYHKRGGRSAGQRTAVRTGTPAWCPPPVQHSEQQRARWCQPRACCVHHPAPSMRGPSNAAHSRHHPPQPRLLLRPGWPVPGTSPACCGAAQCWVGAAWPAGPAAGVCAGWRSCCWPWPPVSDGAGEGTWHRERLSGSGVEKSAPLAARTGGRPAHIAPQV